MIKVFIIAAQTVDGYIAQHDDHPAFWTSNEDKKRFAELTKLADVVVMGSKTFKSLPRPLKETVNIVYSRSKHFEDAETTQDSPNDLLKKLVERGVKTVAVCGGSEIFTMFLEARVVDTIYLTIEPKLFGKGITLFNKPFIHDLKLINQTVTEGGSILLEYRVLYNGNYIFK